MPGRQQRRFILGVDGLTARPGDHIVPVLESRRHPACTRPLYRTGLGNHERCLVYGIRATDPLRIWLATRGVEVQEMERSAQLVMLSDGGNRTQEYGWDLACS
jgi:hypothetical protein